MDKIFYAVTISIFASLVVSFLSTPAFTCSGSRGVVTGGACSIAELNGMSKYKYAQENSSTGPTSARDLRPVKVVDSSDSTGDSICRVGLCLSEKIFSRENVSNPPVEDLKKPCKGEL